MATAGNILGSLFLSFLIPALWLVGGKFIEAISTAMNRHITMIPSLADGVTGLNMIQWIYMGSVVIALLVIWINFALNMSSEANQEV